jgi:hypothetical protein
LIGETRHHGGEAAGFVALQRGGLDPSRVRIERDVLGLAVGNARVQELLFVGFKPEGKAGEKQYSPGLQAATARVFTAGS